MAENKSNQGVRDWGDDCAITIATGDVVQAWTNTAFNDLDYANIVSMRPEGCLLRWHDGVKEVGGRLAFIEWDQIHFIPEKNDLAERDAPKQAQASPTRTMADNPVVARLMELHGLLSDIAGEIEGLLPKEGGNGLDAAKEIVEATGTLRCAIADAIDDQAAQDTGYRRGEALAESVGGAA